MKELVIQLQSSPISILRDFRNAPLYIRCFPPTILIQRSCSIPLKNEPLFAAHAVHSDVTPTLVFFSIIVV